MATQTPRSRPSSLKHPQADAHSQVRVVVRIRPFLPSEIESPSETPPVPCVTVVDADQHSSAGEVTVHLKDQLSSRNECYKLDSFFGQDDDLDQIFHREVSAVILGLFRGFNATVFAYGATGSGKTYTMQGTDDHPGLIPLAISTILSMSKSSGSSVEISYYEVYMDRCYDLLEPKAKEIMVLEDKDGLIQLKGLSKVPVHSMAEFHEAFSCGVQRRKVAHTGLNDVSSRSHGVLSVVVSSGSVSGKLNLIDLAGNEDNRRTCNEGIRLQESAKINQSLFALSNVIYALNNNEPRVPYRESKLTRILQDSLGGTSHALMVACLNPGSYPEAVHTVSLAARSRHIVNYMGNGPKQETPTVKMDMEAKLRAWLESKGKTKGVQRIGGSRSPFLGKTPTSTSCQKRHEMMRSSSKSKANDQGIKQGSVPRKLFDSMASVVANSVDETLLTNKLAGRDESSFSRDGSLSNVHFLPTYEPVQPTANETTTYFEQSEDACPWGAYPEQKQDAVLDEYISTVKEVNGKGNTSPFCTNSQLETLKDTTNDGKENFSAITDSYSDKMELDTPLSRIGESPPINERIHDLQRSLRKVLSPVNSNTTPVKHLKSDDRLCIILVEPRTPKTQPALTSNTEELQISGTPLDKFNALSSNLKDSLAQEYLAFLNVASKEEMLALKGIGQKRAEYILQLREQSPQPLKSLSDLEKIGLSSKQVHDLFRRAARGIFA